MYSKTVSDIIIHLNRDKEIEYFLEKYSILALKPWHKVYSSIWTQPVPRLKQYHNFRHRDILLQP